MSYLIEGVGQVEVRPRHEGRGLDLALGDVEDPGVQVVVVALVGWANRPVGESVGGQGELDDRDAVDEVVRVTGELEGPGTLSTVLLTN